MKNSKYILWLVLVGVIIYLLSISKSEKSNYQAKIDSLELIAKEAERARFLFDELIFSATQEANEIRQERDSLASLRPQVIYRTKSLPEPTRDSLFFATTDTVILEAKDITPKTIESWRLAASNSLFIELDLILKDLILANDLIEFQDTIIQYHVRKDTIEQAERQALIGISEELENWNEELSDSIRIQQRKLKIAKAIIVVEAVLLIIVIL